MIAVSAALLWVAGGDKINQVAIYIYIFFLTNFLNRAKSETWSGGSEAYSWQNIFPLTDDMCVLFFSWNHYCLCLSLRTRVDKRAKDSSAALYLYLLMTLLTPKLKLFTYLEKKKRKILSLSVPSPDPLYSRQAGMSSYSTLVIKRGAEWASLSLFASQSTTQGWCYANEHRGEASAPKLSSLFHSSGRGQGGVTLKLHEGI